MVVVIVADEHDVDRRQIAETDARRAMPLRPDVRRRRAALRPDRIGEDVEVVCLQQRRRVIDEGHAHPSVADALRRLLARRLVDPVAPVAMLAMEHPWGQRAAPMLARLGVEEALSVEVIALRPVVVRRRDELPLDGLAQRHRSRHAERRADDPVHGAHSPAGYLVSSIYMQPGSQLGPYEIIGRIGAGGMGEVWRARDQRLQRDVAVKVLRGTAHTGDALVRFEREARAVAALSHPNILAIHDFGTHGETLYAVMEMLE